MKNEILRMDLCFIPTEVRSILPSHSGSFSILLMLCSRFLSGNVNKCAVEIYPKF